jgi:tripartite-type tricarboxylate transporter receptor subunit TctC
VSDLIRLSKEKPGVINFGSGGVGTSQHLAAELLKATANIDITHIPYRGTAPASKALLANEIQMHFDGVHSAMSQMKTGRVRGIAITSLNRLSTLPDLPTLSESLNGFEATLAYGLLLPTGTPPAVVAALNRDANKVLQDPAFRKQMQDMGISLQGGTPEQFKTFLTNERRKWGDLITRLNIKAS